MTEVGNDVPAIGFPGNINVDQIKVPNAQQVLELP